MIRVLHVSDLHFSQDPQNNNEILKLTDKVYKAGFGENDHLLISGDVADDGDPLQFKNAVKGLKAFAPRILAVPGNHDYGPIGNGYSAASAKYFDANFLPALSIPGPYMKKTTPVVKVLDDGKGTKVLTVGLNSNLMTTTVLDFARGEVGGPQLKALEGVLTSADYAGMPRLVYLHHRPQPCNIFLALRDYEDFMAVVQNRVDVVCFGHTGGDMQAKEPTAARVMTVEPRPFGVKYLLNANSSVEARKYYEIAFDGTAVKVAVK